MKENKIILSVLATTVTCLIIPIILHIVKNCNCNCELEEPELVDVNTKQKFKSIKSQIADLTKQAEALMNVKLK